MKKIKSINIIIYLFYILQALFYILFLGKAINKVSYNYFTYLFIAIFLGISIIILFTYLFKKNDYGLFKSIKNKLIIPLFLITPFIFATYILKLTSSYISYIYLKDIDQFFISFSLVLIVFYLIKNDILSFFRTSTLIFYFYIFLEILTFILLLFYVDFNNLLPITTNLHQAIDNSYLFIIFLVSPILFLLFVPKNLINDGKNFSKKIFFSYLLISIILIIKSIICLSILGYSSLNIYNYPDIILYKNINLFSFIERIEWLLSFNSISNLFFLICLSLFYLKEGLNYLLPLKKNYLYPLCLCFLVFITNIFIDIPYDYVVNALLGFIGINFLYFIYRLIK